MINNKNDIQAKAQKIIKAFGGLGNIVDNNIDNCATRLRLKVKDIELINEHQLTRQGALGFIHLPENQVQIVFYDVHKLADELRKLTSSMSS